MDGHHRHTVYDGVLSHPFALTVFEDFVYWTDWNTRSVEKGNKYDGSGRQALVNTTHRPFDIHVCHPYRQPIGGFKLCVSRAFSCLLSQQSLYVPGSDRQQNNTRLEWGTETI